MAHQDRNRQTVMVLTLTLAFVIFINIVARLPFTKDLQDALKVKGYSNIKIGRMNLPVAEFDEFLQEHQHMFEDGGLVTNQMYNKAEDLYWTQRQAWSYPRGIDDVWINDVSRRMKEKVGVLGATPGFIDVIEPAYQSYVQYQKDITRFSQASKWYDWIY